MSDRDPRASDAIRCHQMPWLASYGVATHRCRLITRVSDGAASPTGISTRYFASRSTLSSPLAAGPRGSASRRPYRRAHAS